MIHYPVQDPSRSAAAYQIVSSIQTADRAKIFRTGPGPVQDRRRTAAGPAQDRCTGPKNFPDTNRQTGARRDQDGSRTGAGRAQTGAGREQDGGRTSAAAWGPCEVILKTLIIYLY